MSSKGVETFVPVMRTRSSSPMRLTLTLPPPMPVLPAGMTTEMFFRSAFLRALANTSVEVPVTLAALISLRSRRCS